MQSFSYDLVLKAKDLTLKHFKDKHSKRFNHVEGVAKMASYLGRKYNLDINRLMASAYFHDYAKYDDFDMLKDKLSNEDREECEKYPFLYHAYLSAIFFREYISDDEICYNAIRNHVFGRENMNIYEAIIMISDFTEENRTYEACINCRHILVDENDLERAIIYSLESTIKHCEEEGSKAHPTQLKIIEEYKNKLKER